MRMRMRIGITRDPKSEPNVFSVRVFDDDFNSDQHLGILVVVVVVAAAVGEI